MNVSSHRYPALIAGWLTPVYDFFSRLFLPEGRVTRALIARACLAAGDRVLDLGAGSGTLAIRLKQIEPDVYLIALDGDAEILGIAREKAARAGAAISFQVGDATAVPYVKGTFDHITVSLVLSLLGNAEKQRVIDEAYRVLAGGGELHIADFGPPRTWWARLVAPLVSRFEPISGNLSGCILPMCHSAGFERVHDTAQLGTLFGTLEILSVRKPGGAAREASEELNSQL